ncbi:MAG TPA: FAD-dependent oxidoreductase, partial [Polyangiaceae bacterium]|nr:FAD-dependent oxidoreductase [Polyangiaceae bacterium]
MPDRAPFVILGGGPCGLAAAWELCRAGARPVVVVEREPLVGGLCATHERDGWRFDLGGHRFVSADAELSRRVEALLGEDLLVGERKSVVLHQGRRFRYPLEARDLLRNLGVRENARAAAGWAVARIAARLRPRPERSFEDWVTARFGRPLYDTFFGPYTHKLWGLHPSLISADWARERISLLDLRDVALRLAGLRRNPVRTYARRYRYPRWGMGQLYAAMAEDVRAHGGHVRTGARVVGVETAGDRVTSVHVDGPTGAEAIPVGELLSTIPLTELARMLLPQAPGPVVAAADRLRFRALAFVNIALARSDFSDCTWTYVANGDVAISRIQEPKRRSRWMAPDGRTSLMLEVPCDVGDATWRAGDADLRARMVSELGRLGFRVDDALSSFVVRVAHGYPVYHLGYERDRRVLLAEVARFANVRTAGR